MIEDTLHRFSKENHLSFENVLAGYVKETILETLLDRGYGNSLWLKNKGSISLHSYKGRAERCLKFVYKEDERVLKSDGFVPGTAFDDEFLVGPICTNSYQASGRQRGNLYANAC